MALRSSLPARTLQPAAQGAWAQMFGARQNFFHRSFALASPVFTVDTLRSLGGALLLLCAALSPLTLTAVAATSPDTTSANARRQAASAQFARAEDQRAALNEKPSAKRTLAEYKQVVSTYRRVSLITPHAPEVPDALLALGELYTEMGDHFGRSYYQSAVDSYRSLLREYPGGRHTQDALLRVAQLEKNELEDVPAATKAYEDFLKKYPHSPHRREAQEARAELALLRNGGGSAAKTGESGTASPEASAPAVRAEQESGNSRASAGRDSASRETREDTAQSVAATLKHDVARVRLISSSATPESTRVTIDLDDAVEYSSARLHNPDRIFFDLHTSRITPDVANRSIHVEGNLLSAVRVAQFHVGIVRVVLNVNGVKDYVASLSGNPPRLVIDLYPGAAPKMAKVVAAAQEAETARAEAASGDAQTARAVPGAGEPVTSVEKVSQPEASGEGTGTVQPASKPVAAPRRPSAGDSSTTTAAALPSPVAKLPSAKLSPKSGGKPDLIQPSTTAQPTRDGQATLTRALGLKIGRIVIDPGHGGHDTGTIGPTGLMEKDLCLDVALRLGKIVQQRLPGADVVYTRSDDTFIPLEERTHIANEAKADLFISIHANSSHDHAARGIETYYLNLKGSPEAMEVAARENATASEGVHDLEDLVKRIARNEKIDESKEFASDIQESLAKRIQKNYKPVKDRGVRKAPFVVLIGADMPSILTEISFLSNPADEQLLKKPEHRQRVAEGLFQGVASYLQSLNSMTMNQPKMPLKPASRTMAAASVEETRNPQ